MKELHRKYRPKRFADVIGQRSLVLSLESQIHRDTSHSFLFTGPSGCGKTTLARITASKLGCKKGGMTEVDAATNTGIDAMRGLTSTLHFAAFGKSGKKAIIVDECHALSTQAWQSILKNVEEPPAHVYWFFCTTNAAKVPPTIKTRCATYNLKLVETILITGLLEDVAEKEGLSIDDEVIHLCSREANGSPRQGLVNLAMCLDCKSKEDAKTVLNTILDQKDVIDLCRLLIGKKRPTWHQLMSQLKDIEGVDPEGIRIIVMNYFAKAVQNSTNESQTTRLLHVMECFREPFDRTTKMAPLILALADVFYDQ